VPDFPGYLARLRERGIELVGGPRDRGDGVRQANMTDPDGNVFEIMGM
jgi:glyoxylase I family protein